MNINVSGVNQTQNLENNVNQGQIAGGRVQVSVPTAAPSKEAGITLLQSLNPGDVFTGRITDITQNQITLLLSNSAAVKATLADALSFNIGDMASFSIKDNTGEQIVLKSVNRENLNNLMNDRTVRTAIQSAGLSVNETTVSLVHNLMKQQMPIDANTLNRYVKMLDMLPNATPEDVVLMSKMGIPITEDNVNALHDYYDFSEGISAKAEDMAMKAAGIASELASESVEEAAQFIDDFVSAFSAEQGTVENMGAAIDGSILDRLSEQLKEMADIPVSDKETPENAENTKNAENAENSVGGASASGKKPLDKADIKNTGNTAKEESLTPFQEQVSNLSERVKNGNITARQFLNELSLLMNKPEANKEAAKKLLGGGEFAKTVENTVRQEMFLKPEEVSKESLKRLYAKIINDSNSIAEKFGGNAKMSPIVNNAAQTASDVQFLNDASHFMSFVQIPIKMSGQNAHGDLYVYKNKRNRTENNDELKALLHLDMDNLGPMDIFVALKSNNVTTDFKVANDDILDYIESHMDELTAALNKKGYNVTNVVEISGKNYSFKTSVIEEEVPPTQVKRITFDVRA